MGKHIAENKKHQKVGNSLSDEKMDALRYAAARVADYGAPVDMVYAPPKTTILIIETNGKQETIAVDTGNMSPGEIDYLQKKLVDGAQLSVEGHQDNGLVIQSKLIISDHTITWLDDIQSSDVSLTDIITRYKSLLTRIYTMCMTAVDFDDMNMHATLKSITTMIDDEG